METARLKVQAIYSLLAGLLLLLGVPLYQAVVLAPAGYQAPATAAFSQGNYGPLLLWIGSNSQPFIFFRLLELGIFLLLLRLPIALAHTLRRQGHTLARWVSIAGTGGLILFSTMLALSTITLVNTANNYQQPAGNLETQSALLKNFQAFYGIETLVQNTLGGALLAIFLLCASLLIARTGKLSALFVYFGLLTAALMAGLALLYAFSPLSAQTQLTTPALASFAVWLIWLAILLLQRARRLVTPALTITAPTTQPESGLPAIASPSQDTPLKQVHEQATAAQAEQTPPMSESGTENNPLPDTP
jgi:hypothetical protein